MINTTTKLIAGFIVLFLQTSTASAQKIELTWGDKVDAKFGNEIVGIVGQDQEGFYLVKAVQKNAMGKAILSSGFFSLGSLTWVSTNATPYAFRVPVNGRSKFYVEKCDKNCNPIFTEQIDFPAPDGKEKDMVFESMILAKDQLLMFSSYYNKKSDMNYAFATPLTAKGKTQTFSEIDVIEADKKKNNGNFDFILSKDSSKILVFHNEPYEKKENEKFAIKIIDKSRAVLWERFVELPYRDKDVKIDNWVLDNNGKVYVLGKYQVGKKERKNGKPNYSYFILAYEDATSEPVEYTVSLGREFISNVNFSVDPSGDLICAGLYSKISSDGATGAFYLRINGGTKDIVVSNKKPFDTKTREKLMRKGKAKKEREFPDFVLRDLIMREDGGAVLVAEQSWTFQEIVQTKYGTRTVYHFYNNAILVVNIDPDGDIKWVSAIPKWQHTINDNAYYSSYAMATYKDKLIFVFNDNKKNAGIKDFRKIKPMRNIRGCHALIVVIDGKGEVQKKSLMSNKTTKGLYIRPKVYLQTASDQLILVAKKTNGDYMLGSLKFK